MWAALTDPAALDYWWGPAGFVTRTIRHEAVVGGSWEYTMDHPEQGFYPNHNHNRYLAVEPGVRLVYESLEDGVVLFEVELALQATAGGTDLTLRATFPTVEARDAAVTEVDAEEGGRQTLARLGRLLGEPRDPTLNLTIAADGDRNVVVTRHFNASAQRVWDAFVSPELVRQWLGTPEWPMTVCEIDLKVGGHFRYVWSNDRGGMGMTGTYVALAPPLRIDHTELFDEDWTDGDATVTTHFVEFGGGTTMVMEILYTSAAVRDAVLASPMRQGMNLNFNNLEQFFNTESSR